MATAYRRATQPLRRTRIASTRYVSGFTFFPATSGPMRSSKNARSTGWNETKPFIAAQSLYDERPAANVSQGGFPYGPRAPRRRTRLDHAPRLGGQARAGRSRQ